MTGHRRGTESGLALVTVLFVGAVLSVVTTGAAYLTVKTLKATSDDQRSAQATSFAEAAIDRLLLDVGRGTYGWDTIREAGCANAPITLPLTSFSNGTYTAVLTIYEPTTAQKIPASPWTIANDTMSGGPCTAPGRSSVNTPNTFAITATGTQATGRRVLRQILRISPTSTKLPIGVFANRIDANGSPTLRNVSVITSGDIIGREKIRMEGTDQAYTLKDFYCQVPTSTGCSSPVFTWGGGMTWSSPIPAAVHSTGSIYYRQGGGNRREHPVAGNRDCNANGQGTAGQSLWDGSGAGGPITSTCANWTGPNAGAFPPTSLFRSADLNRVAPLSSFSEGDYQVLKAAAQASGIYCSYAGAGTCTRAGIAGTSTPPGVFNNGWIDACVCPRSFIVYLEYPLGTNPAANVINWQATVQASSAPQPCNPDPAINRSVILVIRNASLDISGNAIVNGAIMVAEGNFDSSGNMLVHGTVLVTRGSFRIRGTGTFQSDPCWTGSVNGALLDVTPTTFQDVDR
jgi:type II secretory pathway pseudopilin PulG